jgi:2-oxoisovalerate dehydrogenase E1 component beta subunit
MATLTVLQAVNDALKTEMRRDDRVVCLGEDIGRNGGVFRATEGLQTEFGADRVIDTPLAESGIIGAAIGMALYGLKPVPEIQFLDFVYPAFDQIVSEAAKLRYRSGGQFPCPMVIRSPYGGGIKGGHYHSQSSEAYFCHTPGLQVVIPSTPYDTKGLLASAIRGEDPVMFLEPKRIYRSVKGEVPEGEYTVPIGKAAVAREGTQVTLVSWGSMTHVCLEAAEKAQAEKGVSCEVLDLRSLVPLDKPALLESVKKTGRVVVVCEAPRTGSFAGEISAIVAEEAIDSMEAPIVRVTGFDTPFPYTLEHAYMPNAGRVIKAIETVMNY